MMEQRKKEEIVMNSKQLLYYGEMNSPLGPLTIVSSTEGVCSIEFGKANELIDIIQPWIKKHLFTNKVERNDAFCEPVIVQLQEYFEKKRKTFDLDLDLNGTPFQKKVWQKLTEIPYGATYSYKQVAQMIGVPKAVRAVGGANNKNPIPIIIPCHRVVGSNGALVGYGGGLDKKEILLGIEQTTNQVIN
jgi:O-6-methylguanine DNA methyltransferase